MNNIKKLVKEFIKEKKLVTITSSSLKKAVEEDGYCVIEFESSLCDNNVRDIIDSLHLKEFVSCSRGFTYVSKNYRFIFINSDLSEKEKLIVLAHEIGHICCKHFGKRSIIGQDVHEEYEANEFAHYLLEVSIPRKIQIQITTHKRTAAVIGISVMIITIVSIFFCYKNNEQFYNNEYYVTSSGTHYHLKNCYYIKNKTNIRRLGDKELRSGDYSPCSVCINK